jgi:HTH-type transcriptional repressor of NAD biosynthesis genes
VTAPRHGMVLGKFLPPHAGHVYLVEVARRLCDDLTVVVGSLARESIPGALRVEWMRALFPGVRVVHLTDENPQDPSEHPRFWEIWRASLLAALPRAPDLVFASEAYGARLAEVLGARFVPVDPGRLALPVSGSAIRRDPLASWAYLPRPVRPYFLRRVSVFGPESTGKTTLATRLAAHLGSLAVPEYARTHLEARPAGTAVSEDDLAAIARGQVASEEALAFEANRVLVADTDPLLTCVWSETLFGRTPAWLAAAAAARRYELTLLLDVDVPWVADAVRYLPDDRAPFFARCEAALRAADRRYVVLRGDHEARFTTACAALDALLAPRPPEAAA